MSELSEPGPAANAPHRSLVAIVGAGHFGRALAWAAARTGEVLVWSRSPADLAHPRIRVTGELAELVAGGGEGAVEQKTTELDDMKITLKENIEIGRVARFEGAEGDALEAYVHQQNGRGVNAVLVHLAGGSAEQARDVAMHAAFTRPKYVSRDEVPAADVEAEREMLMQLSRNEGKPEAALEKIVEGRMAGWFKEHTLLEQKFVKDEKQTVSGILGDAQLAGFAQIEIGG